MDRESIGTEGNKLIAGNCKYRRNGVYDKKNIGHFDEHQNSE